MSEVYEIYHFEHDPKAETVYVEAEVEDSVLACSATLYEPEQWTHGRCTATIFWFDEDGPLTTESLKNYLNQNQNTDWLFIPPDNSLENHDF